MKILLVEDNLNYIEIFSKQLSALGEVTVFKSLQGTVRWLDDNGSDLDLVVCDHNILSHEDPQSRTVPATDIYFELRFFKNKTVPFIHFSYEPCPERYIHQPDAHFYSLEKRDDVNLINFINEKVLKKK